MIALHRRRRLEVIIETPARGLVIDALERNGAPGYTVLPALGGRGLSSSWDRNQLTDAANQVMIIAIVGAEVADKIVAAVASLLDDYRGVISVTDVEVVRAGRF